MRRGMCLSQDIWDSEIGRGALEQLKLSSEEVLRDRSLGDVSPFSLAGSEGGAGMTRAGNIMAHPQSYTIGVLLLFST